MPINPIAVRCNIFRGGFSGERVVEIECADGKKRKGMAPTQYCWTAAQKPLGDDEPENGKPIVGFVAARFYAKSGNQITIEIPDGEVMIVSGENVINRPEVRAHVLV
jgi:hypothetical protein